jgi:hypothetical protein
MDNLVPLPYSRVAVQHAEGALDESGIRQFLDGKEVWFETDYVIFRRGDACAIARVEKSAPSGLFGRVTAVEIVSLPESTRWVDDPSVDSGNACALAEKARALAIDPTETLVVNGRYEHVCFLHRPAPIVIDVFDLSPPEPPRLLDLARRVLAYQPLPPTVIRPRVQAISELVRDVSGRTLLFPCGVSQLKRDYDAFYLDERPERHDWLLVGCERSREIHRHIYGEDCPSIELCPKRIFDARGALALMRCCLVEKRVELCGRVAFVPWGAELPLVEEAIAALVALPVAAES